MVSRCEQSARRVRRSMLAARDAWIQERLSEGCEIKSLRFVVDSAGCHRMVGAELDNGSVIDYYEPRVTDMIRPAGSR